MNNPIIDVISYEWIKEFMSKKIVFNSKDIFEHLPLSHFFPDGKITEDDIRNEYGNIEALMECLADETGYEVEFDKDGNYFTAWPCRGGEIKDVYENDDVTEWITDYRTTNPDGKITIPIRLLRMMFTNDHLIEGPNPGTELYMGMYGGECVLSKDEESLEDAKSIKVVRCQKEKDGSGKLTINLNGLFDECEDANNQEFEVSYAPDENQIHIILN